MLYCRLYPRVLLVIPSNTSGRECRNVFLAYESLVLVGALMSSDSLLVEFTTDLALSRSFSDTPNVRVWCRRLGLAVSWDERRLSFISLKLFDLVLVLAVDSVLVERIDTGSCAPGLLSADKYSPPGFLLGCGGSG